MRYTGKINFPSNLLVMLFMQFGNRNICHETWGSLEIPVITGNKHFLNPIEHSRSKNTNKL